MRQAMLGVKHSVDAALRDSPPRLVAKDFQVPTFSCGRAATVCALTRHWLARALTVYCDDPNVLSVAKTVTLEHFPPATLEFPPIRQTHSIQ